MCLSKETAGWLMMGLFVKASLGSGSDSSRAVLLNVSEHELFWSEKQKSRSRFGAATETSLEDPLKRSPVKHLHSVFDIF